MKVLASFQKPEEAHLVRSILEGSGIAAHVRDEYVVTNELLASTAFGGVKVVVADEDFERACDVLKNSGTETGAAE